MLAAMNPPAKVPVRMTADGPITNVKNIGPLFSRRFAQYSGKLGSIQTPRQYARLLHSHVGTKIAGVAGHHDRIRQNLKNIISVACQNPPTKSCSRSDEGPPRIGKVGRFAGKKLARLHPYMKRDTNSGCALASACLFDVLYGKTAVPHVNYSQANATAIAAEIAMHFTEPRMSFPTKLVPTFYPSASCPCITDEAICGAAPWCSWRPAVAGAGVPGFPNSSACVPTKTPAVAGSFPGILGFAGQSFKMAKKATRRANSSYASYAPTGTFWRRRAVAGLPVVPLPGVPAWPS